ncbi:mevalonate kinase [Streptomyces sp. NPDC056534]|uniref:mevalonate kinase n=1 Tax=Streptomyces sp. NPDC056534 TaxID=3345857 RepID=UPI003681E114
MTLPASVQGGPKNFSVRQFGMGFAHGKIILLGEHAVVYGAPALALPVPGLTVTAKAVLSSRPSGHPGDATFTMAGIVPAPAPVETGETLRRIVVDFKKTTGIKVDTPIDIVIDSGIPAGRGLGSSAACARSVVLALADLFGRQLNPGTIFDLVQAAENLTHGRASGIDTLATGSSTPVLLTGGVTREPEVEIDGIFVIGDSGEVGRTNEAVGMLRRRFQRDPQAQEEFLARVSTLTSLAVRDLADGQAGNFGARMIACHAALREAGLSTDRIDTLVGVALTAGSLGAKISGGGLGGCVIALADRPERAQEISSRLLGAGAERTWTVPVGRFARHGHS